MLQSISLFLVGALTMLTNLVSPHPAQPIPQQQYTNQQEVTAVPQQQSLPTSQHIYTDDELMAMADNKYADGNVPLGDNKYVTDGPKKGYIYLCHVQKENNVGAGTNGPWVKESTWNFLNKVSVKGAVSWPNALFSNTISGDKRTLAGNDLPISHTTGTYPIQSTDPAYAYDRNPNSIKSQTLSDSVAANPTYSDTPYCMGGEVGVMLSGVALFNGFDAELRDAPAHELQDSCDGHPQESGEYHYHSMSNCFKDISEKTVLGYALDGYPITGPKMAENKYLTTEDLDECHGITSEIVVDGKKVTTYHYVMTRDFPYSASCFRGKAIQPSGINGGNKQNQSQSGQSQMSQGQKMGQNQNSQPGQPNGQPPQEAITACSGKTAGSACSFSTPRGDTIAGSCQTPPSGSLTCVPTR